MMTNSPTSTFATKETAQQRPLSGKEDALVRLGGDEELYQNLLAMLSVKLPNWETELLDLTTYGDHTKLASLTHTIKSESASVGAEALSLQAKKAEQLFRKSNNGHTPESATKALEPLLSELRLLIEHLTPGTA